jgi:hypothetical protein
VQESKIYKLVMGSKASENASLRRKLVKKEQKTAQEKNEREE